MHPKAMPVRIGQSPAFGAARIGLHGRLSRIAGMCLSFLSSSSHIGQGAARIILVHFLDTTNQAEACKARHLATDMLPKVPAWATFCVTADAPE